MAYFHERAIALYGVAQTSEGVSAVRAASDAVTTAQKTQGTATTTLASDQVTGGTAFLTDLAIGAYLYTNAGVEIGRIKSVASDTTATLYAPALVAITAATFQTGLGALNALAATDLTYSTDLTTEQFIYVGNEISRDEETVVTDTQAKMSFSTFLPKLGTIAGGTPTIDEVPMADWMEAAAFSVVLSAGQVKYTNSIASNEFLTIEVRRSSPDLIGTQKTFTLSDCRGTVDWEGTVGTRVKLKFDFLGNIDSVLDKPELVEDFNNQKSLKAASLKSSAITLSELKLYALGSDVEPALDNVTNFCFDKINAPNLTGFEYDRYLTSCIDGWSKGAIASDVSVTIIEEEAGAAYNPDNNLERPHVASIKFGDATVAGEQVQVTFHKVILGSITNSTVAKFSGQDLSFRNVGTTDIILT